MVTNSYRAYPEIIKEFDMIQQRCVFHMMYNVGQTVYPTINKDNKKKQKQIQQTRQIKQTTKIKKIRKE